jgi:hypothetical protein
VVSFTGFRIQTKVLPRTARGFSSACLVARNAANIRSSTIKPDKHTAYGKYARERKRAKVEASLLDSCANLRNVSRDRELVPRLNRLDRSRKIRPSDYRRIRDKSAAGDPHAEALWYRFKT